MIRDREEVLALWRTGTNPGRIHKKTGISIHRVCQIINDESRITDDTKGYGREEMRQYIVSRRPVHGPWPAADEPSLQRARRGYDAGLLEMCQGRAGDVIIQYAIPRQEPCAPRNYFAPVL